MTLLAAFRPTALNPEAQHGSTSFIERQNLTLRRFTRLTNGFSKSSENHKHSIALHFLHYNFMRWHQTIRTTPAIMAGVTDRQWVMEDFVKMMEQAETMKGGRLTNYKPAASKRREI